MALLKELCEDCVSGEIPKPILDMSDFIWGWLRKSLFCNWLKQKAPPVLSEASDTIMKLFDIEEFPKFVSKSRRISSYQTEKSSGKKFGREICVLTMDL